MEPELTALVFPRSLEIVATIAWATSGAIVARQRGFDVMGVLFIAVIASSGGGLIRDGVFLNRTPVMVTDTIYLIIPFACAAVVTVFGSLLEKIEWWPLVVNAIDALGTPAFTILGFQLSILAGVPLVGAIFIGLINGTAGGILRDVLVGDVPQLFRPGQMFGLIVIATTLLYAILLSVPSISSDAAAWITIIAATVARLLVIRFNWRTRPVTDFEADVLLRRAEDLSRWPRWVQQRWEERRIDYTDKSDEEQF